MAKKVKEKKPLYANPIFIFLGVVFSVVLLLGIAVFTSYHGIGLSHEEDAEENGEIVEAYDEENGYENDLEEEPGEDEPLLDVPRPEIHGFLSRFEYNNHTAYVLGSMHMGRANWFPLSPMVEDAMDRSDVFAFEIDLAMMAALEDADFGGFADMFAEMIELIAVIFELSMMPDGMTLEDLLDEDVFENFYAMLETFPFISYDDVADMTPLAASMAIMEYITDGIGGVYAQYSVDMYVMDFAVERGLPVLGLNSLLSELTLMYDVPLVIQATMFDVFLDYETTVAMSAQLMDTMVEAYESGDGDAIHYVSFVLPLAENNPYALFMHDVFLQRCNIFGAEILRLLRETEEPTTFFITVGAAHVLYGHIFGMLEAEGIEITELWR